MARTSKRTSKRVEPVGASPVVLRAGRFFYRSSPGDMKLHPGRPIWMTTSIWHAWSFGYPVVWRLRLRRDVRVVQLDGPNAWINIADLVGVKPTEESLYAAAKAFCRQRPFGAKGWHMPSFHGKGASDTMLCTPDDVEIDRQLADAEVARSSYRS